MNLTIDEFDVELDFNEIDEFWRIFVNLVSFFYKVLGFFMNYDETLTNCGTLEEFLTSFSKSDKLCIL